MSASEHIWGTPHLPTPAQMWTCCVMADGYCVLFLYSTFCMLPREHQIQSYIVSQATPMIPQPCTIFLFISSLL